MGKHKRAIGLGLHQNDAVKDINKSMWHKKLTTIEVNDAWRKAKKDDPDIEFKMSFLEFKKQYLKRKHK